MKPISRLFTEARRRRVFRTAGLYVVGAWAILQVADLAVDSWGLPAQAMRILWVAALVGFPVALLFGWRYDITSAGIIHTQDDGDETVRPLGAVDYLILTALAGIAVLSVFLLADRVTEVSPDNPVASVAAIELDHSAIAVLPFATFSADDDTRYFADGVHDDLLTTLSNIDGLKVISRTSVLEYRDTTKRVMQIGTELGAGNILEGSVRQVGDNLRVNMQLIRADVDEHLWARTYDRKMTMENVFAIQSEIVETIAAELAMNLTPRERQRVTRERTDNLEAFTAYSRGRQHIATASFQALRDAEAAFKRALELDPDYVDARVALANTYAGLAQTGAASVADMLVAGQEHIDRALELDPEYPYAIVVSAQYLQMAGVPGARARFEQAVELNPGSVDVLDIYASYLRAVDRNEEALQVTQRALVLDPLSTTLFHDLGRTFVALGRFAEAKQAFARIAAINPDSPYAAHGSALATILAGELVEAADWSDKAAAMDPLDFENPSTSVLIVGSFGDMERAERLLDEALRLGPEEAYPLAAQTYLLTIKGERAQAESVARFALANEVDDRWNSHYFLLRTVRDAALDSGQYAEALAWYRKLTPELFGGMPAIISTTITAATDDDQVGKAFDLQGERVGSNNAPIINSRNILKAADLGHLLMAAGHEEEATRLLNIVVSRYDEIYTLGSANFPLGIASVDALALLGRTDDAVATFSKLIDDGYRMVWKWSTLLNRNHDNLHDRADYQALLQEIETDLQAQRLSFEGQGNKRAAN